MDNLYRLRIFLHLCKTLNFSESARQLHLAQPAISRHIKELEEETGSPLFLRYKKKVQLSEAGKTLFQKISPILSEYDRIFRDFKEKTETIEGILRIGSVHEAGKYLLLDHLIQFQKKYPDIIVKLELGSTDEILEKMTQGQLDFALVSRSDLSPSLSSLSLFKDFPVMVGLQDSKKQNWDSQEIPLLYYRDDDYYANDFIEKNFTKAQRKNIKLKGIVNSHEAMLNWTMATGAYSIVPYSSWNRFSAKHKLKILKSSHKDLTLDLIYIKNSLTEFRKKIFLDEMKQMVLDSAAPRS